MKNQVRALLVLPLFAVSVVAQVNPTVTAVSHHSSLTASTPSVPKGTRARVVADGDVEASQPTAPSMAQSVSTIDAGDTARNNPYRRIAPALLKAPVTASLETPRGRTKIKPPGSNSTSANESTVGIASSMTEIYKVGVGDVLDVQLPQSPNNRSTLFTVLENGELDHPLVANPVSVAGLTASEIATLLRQEIKVLDHPTVVVKVRDYASHSVTVSGMVGAPGPKAIQREAVPLYVVISQSLPLPTATRATIVRSGRELVTVELSDSKGSATLIMPGDNIKVSGLPPGSTEFFFAGGEINAPGQKLFHSGLTLTQAILASGGLRKNAGTKVIVSRQASDGRLVRTDYNFRNIQSGKIADPILQKGDRILVEAK